MRKGKAMEGMAGADVWGGTAMEDRGGMGKVRKGGECANMIAMRRSNPKAGMGEEQQ